MTPNLCHADEEGWDMYGIGGMLDLISTLLGLVAAALYANYVWTITKAQQELSIEHR